MKMSYLSMDMFFGLIDNVRCSEARSVIEKMIEAVETMRQLADDAGLDSAVKAEGITFAADILQEALEDYLCVHSKHQQMLEQPMERFRD